MAKLSEERWIELYRGLVRELYGYASRRSGADRQLAEDATQEAWLRALAEWRRVGEPRQPLAWLQSVVRNLLRNHFRDRAPARTRAGELDLEAPAIEPATSRAAALLQWGLGHLGDEEARLIEAHHLDGVALGALARELGVSERAVEGRLRRSRRTLRQVLLPYLEA